MQISDLLRYRNDVISALEFINLSQPMQDIHTRLHQLATTHPYDIGTDKINQAKVKFEELITKSNDINKDISTILVDIDLAVDLLASQKFTDTELLFYNLCSALEFNISVEVINTVTAHIHQNANFHFPALQLGCTPQSKILTHELVANDPLYLCDKDEARIESIAEQFNEIYYRRIRKYSIFDNDLSCLPHNQFGFVLSWMLFNYTNFTCIQEYLKKVIVLLRPGGRFLFSYNNCDLLESCELAEKGGMRYTTKRQLLAACKAVGFEIVHHYDIANDDHEVKWISWVEIKKPGELTTIKRRQVMGAIHQK